MDHQEGSIDAIETEQTSKCLGIPGLLNKIKSLYMPFENQLETTWEKNI